MTQRTPIVQPPIVQPLLLAVVLAVGFGLAWGVAATLCGEFVKDVGQANRAGKSRVRRSIKVLPDGTLVIKSSTNYDTLSSTYETLDGEPIVAPQPDALPRGIGLPLPGGPRGPWGEQDFRRAMEFVDTGAESPVYWYLIHDGEFDGTGYLAGYDRVSKLNVGYIGRDGFRSGKPLPGARFSINGSMIGHGRGAIVSGRDYRWRDSVDLPGNGGAARIPPWMVYLISGDQLLRIDLRERSVSALLESPRLQRITSVPPSTTDESAEKPQPRGDLLALRTSDRILILDPGGSEHGRYVIPEVLRDEGFKFYELGEETAMARLNPSFAGDGTERHRFFRFDSRGNIQDEKSVDLPTMWQVNHSRMVCVIGTAVPVPVVATPTVFLQVSDSYVDSGQFPSNVSALAQVLWDTWPGLLTINLLGAALAYVCYRRQKKFDQPWTSVWVGFVFLFGLPGLVGYLFHRQWPVRLPCPTCNALVPRDRESCCECGEEFPEPARQGIEVLLKPCNAIN